MYEREGRSPPVNLCHGGVCSALQFQESNLTLNLIQAILCIACALLVITNLIAEILRELLEGLKVGHGVLCLTLLIYTKLGSCVPVVDGSSAHGLLLIYGKVVTYSITEQLFELSTFSFGNCDSTIAISSINCSVGSAIRGDPLLISDE